MQHTVDFDEGVEMHLADVSDLVRHGQIFDTHMDFGADLLIVWELFEHNFLCRTIKDGEHFGWRVC